MNEPVDEADRHWAALCQLSRSSERHGRRHGSGGPRRVLYNLLWDEPYGIGLHKGDDASRTFRHDRRVEVMANEDRTRAAQHSPVRRHRQPPDRDSPGLPVRGRSVVALALCLLLSACGHDSVGSGLGTGPARAYTKGQVDRFVLRSGDLPAGYKKVRSQSGRVDCDSGYLANRGLLAETEQEAALKQQILLLGPEGCQLSTYERTEGGGTTGFQILAVVYGDDRGASSSLPLFRRSFVEFSAFDEPAEDIAAPGLGDESMSGIRWKSQGARGQGLSFPEVHIWRLGNVAVVLQASVTAGVKADDIVEVGRRVNAHAAKK